MSVEAVILAVCTVLVVVAIALRATQVVGWVPFAFIVLAILAGGAFVYFKLVAEPAAEADRIRARREETKRLLASLPGGSPLHEPLSEKTARALS